MISRFVVRNTLWFLSERLSTVAMNIEHLCRHHVDDERRQIAEEIRQANDEAIVHLTRLSLQERLGLESVLSPKAPPMLPDEVPLGEPVPVAIPVEISVVIPLRTSRS